MQENLKRYIELSAWIRELSSPQIEETENSEHYRLNLITSFNRIGELAQINQAILDEHFFRLLSSEKVLPPDIREALMTFKDALIDPTHMENIDLPILYVQTEKLLEDAEKLNDTRSIIISLDTMVIACYAILTSTLRLYPPYTLCFDYRDKGIAAANKLIEYLEPDKFRALDDDCKELVLINSRYISGLFEWGDHEHSDEQVEADLAVLEKALAIAYDPFYLEQAPDYDWDYHIVRTLQYISCYTEFRHSKTFDKDIMQKVCDYTEQFIEELHKRCPELEEECSEVTQNLYLWRNQYLAGRISEDEYKDLLHDVSRQDKVEIASMDELYPIFTAPYEYILLLDKENLSERDKEFLRDYYSGLASYLYNFPKAVILSVLMTFISCMIDTYIEVEGAPTINDMCLNLMAALHPPTYVHSQTVAELTLCLTSHLLDKEPERFIGILGIKTAEEAAARKDEILEFTRQATLLHDIGKIYIIETIMTYGRRLLDMEFDFIKTHPEVGAYILESHEGTKEFADLARGHHKWFNDKGGYPDEFKMAESKYQVLVSLLSVADCLDAATDTVGRNYKKSKTFDEYIEEIAADSGTRYAPYAVDLLRDPEVYKEMESILENSRDANYRKTYEILKDL